MRDLEYNLYPEIAPSAPEIFPPPSEMQSSDEYSKTDERFICCENNEDSQKKPKTACRGTLQKPNTSSFAMRFLSVSLSASAVITVASVVSNGAFLPQLGEKAIAIYEQLAVPAVVPRKGLDISEVTMAWHTGIAQRRGASS